MQPGATNTLTTINNQGSQSAISKKDRIFSNTYLLAISSNHLRG